MELPPDQESIGVHALPDTDEPEVERPALHDVRIVRLLAIVGIVRIEVRRQNDIVLV